MIKLLKYELLRKKKAYIIVLCIFAALTLLSVIAIPNIDKVAWTIFLFVSAVVCIVGCAVFPFIINVANYYGDYKRRNGYMMFLTPSSGAKIFGSKILAAVIDALVFFAMFVLYGFLAYSVANANYDLTPVLNNFWLELQKVFPSFNYGAVITMFAVTVLLQNVATIILALFSITVSKTLLSHKSINWFIPLLIFIALKWIEQTVTTLIIAAANFKDVGEMITSSNPSLDIASILITTMGIYAVFAAAYTFTSSKLISKKLDL